MNSTLINAHSQLLLIILCAVAFFYNTQLCKQCNLIGTRNKILTLSYLFAFQTQNKTHVDLRIDIYVCTVVYWHINPIMCFISVMCGSGFKNVPYETFLMT